jgi:hypothetical protein
MTSRLPIAVVAIAVLCAASTEARADELEDASSPFLERHPFNLMLGVYVGAAWLDPRSAELRGYEDAAVAYSFALGAIAFDLVNASFSLGAALPSDHEPFAMAGYDSAVNMMELTFVIGPRMPYLCLVGTGSHCFALALFGNVGYSYIETYRMVSLPEDTYCPDCETEELGDEWSWVLELGAGLGSPSRGAVGVELAPLWRIHPGSSFRNHDLLFGLIVTAL